MISELSNALFQLLIDHSNKFVQQVKENPESPFHSINQVILIQELMILSFWNLIFLQCPLNLWQATLSNFFHLIEVKDNEKQKVSKFIDERVKSYSDSWAKSSANNSTMMFAAEASKNIDNDLFLNMFAHMEVMEFFRTLTETNSRLLKYIKDDIKLV